MRGFDGKKLTAPGNHGGRDGSNGRSSQGSAPSSTAATAEVDNLKAMVRQLANGQPLTTEQQKILKKDPLEEIRLQQRQLNADKKKLNKEQKLQAKLEENKLNYEKWLVEQKEIIRGEKQRYAEVQEKLQKDLEKLLQEQEEDMAQEEMDSEEELFGLPPKADVEQRLLQAEQQAIASQQAMMAMQNQLQQMLAYTGAAYQQSADASAYVAQMAQQATPMRMPGTGSSPKINAASPQLPRHVKKETQNGHARVQKGHLKGAKPTEKPEKTGTAAPEEEQKDPTETIIVIADEEDKEDTENL